MVVITVEPDWAKPLDFGTTIPKAVEDLVLARQGVAVVDGADRQRRAGGGAGAA